MEIKYQVFVSSTYEDLKEERKEATQAILESHCIPAGMELFPATNKAQWDVIKKVIDDSDFYLLIIAGKYGSIGIDSSGKRVSYTEMEFDYAISSGKPVLALIFENIDLLPAAKKESTKRKAHLLEEFRKKASTGRMIKKWSNKDNLKSAVLFSLAELKRNTDATGWIRADIKFDQQMFGFVEQQRLQYEAKITKLKADLDVSVIEIKRKTDKNKELNDEIGKLRNQLEKLNKDNLHLSNSLMQKDDFWACLLRINTAYNNIADTSERLLSDLVKERPLTDPEYWFLKQHGSRSLWADVINKADYLLLEYELTSAEQKDVYINSFDSMISKYSSESYDPYIMSCDEVIELTSYLFLLLKLCEKYKYSDSFTVLSTKKKECSSLCYKLLDMAWDEELALCENDC